MEQHSSFEIPLEALTDGTHKFAFTLSREFFSAFEGDLIRGGDVATQIEVDKIRGHYTLRFRGDGDVDVECDRCLQEFALPIEFEDEVVLKFEGLSIREEAEVIYLPVGTETFNIARLLYEYASLAVPMSHVHEDAGLTCDEEMTKFLRNEEEDQTQEQTEGDSSIAEDSPWAALRDFGPTDN